VDNYLFINSAKLPIHTNSHLKQGNPHFVLPLLLHLTTGFNKYVGNPARQLMNKFFKSWYVDSDRTTQHLCARPLVVHYPFMVCIQKWSFILTFHTGLLTLNMVSSQPLVQK